MPKLLKAQRPYKQWQKEGYPGVCVCVRVRARERALAGTRTCSLSFHFRIKWTKFCGPALLQVPDRSSERDSEIPVKTRQLRGKFELVYSCLQNLFKTFLIRKILYTPTNRTAVQYRIWDAVLHEASSFFLFTVTRCSTIVCFSKVSFLCNMSFSVSRLASMESKKYEKKSWVNFNVKQEPELIKNLECGVSMTTLCAKCGVKQQTVPDSKQSRSDGHKH